MPNSTPSRCESALSCQDSGHEAGLWGPWSPVLLRMSISQGPCQMGMSPQVGDWASRFRLRGNFLYGPSESGQKGMPGPVGPVHCNVCGGLPFRRDLSHGPLSWEIGCTKCIWRPESGWFSPLLSVTLSQFLHVSRAGPFFRTTGGILA